MLISIFSSHMRIITLLILITISLSLAREQDVAAQQRALDSIRLDVEALKRVRLEKTNQLEKADAIRYQNRSIQNQAHLEYQNETRILEGNYSRVSDNISRMATELGSLRNLATEQKERAGTSKNSLDNFYLQVKQAVDKSIEEIPQDFPAKKEERLLNFASNPPTIETFFNDRFDRLALTQTQELSVKNSYRLRLGTVFFADAAWGQSNDVQAVFRTGSLTGKIFDWHNTFSKELSTDIRRTVFNAQQGADIAWVPIDILQTKSVLGASMGEDIARSERLVQWFKAGGIVMYPLILVALAALFMALERFFVFWKRGHISKTFTNKLYALVKNNQIAEARQLCKKQKTSLGKILGSIVENSDKGKEQTLKTLQEILLAEQAGFDKRMSFLAALGTIAPLLGLLGTVTGMITLFQVITQAGTNDARLLAGGISEALITTETGLIIAIPVMLIHGKLSETLNFITTEIRIQSLTLLNIFWKDE